MLQLFSAHTALHFFPCPSRELWFPQEETTVSLHGNAGSHLWERSFLSAGTVVPKGGNDSFLPLGNCNIPYMKELQKALERHKIEAEMEYKISGRWEDDRAMKRNAKKREDKEEKTFHRLISGIKRKRTREVALTLS